MHGWGFLGLGGGGLVKELIHRSREREDVIGCVWKGGKVGKGITFEM